jgi:hypothetical protein
MHIPGQIDFVYYNAPLALGNKVGLRANAVHLRFRRRGAIFCLAKREFVFPGLTRNPLKFSSYQVK